MAKSLDIIDPKKELDTDLVRSEKEEEREDQVIQASKHEESSGGGVFYLVIGIIAVVVSAALALYILFKDNKPSDSNAALVNASITSTATAAASATSSTTASTTAASSTTPAVAVSQGAYKYTNEQIRIANGNGISGEASKIKTLLESKGYKIASTGNASKDYSTTIIYYKTGREKLASALKTDIASEYSATIQNSDDNVGSYDAVIALGSK